MKKGLLLTLAVALLVGCKAPGATSLPSPWQTSAQSSKAQVEKTAPQNENQGAGFSISSLFQMAGFQAPESTTSSLVPQEVVELGKVISSVTEQSRQLDTNDAPEVTRQKAAGILTSLQNWDSLLAAGTSTGLVSQEMAQSLNTLVTQIRGEAQKLVKFAPEPQTIAAIKQLTGGLHATFGNLNTMFNQANALSGSSAE